ncbi:MAG: bifunctional serine/threonine-protein kinase/formylglycine-generating enzyme family protein, partial [Acidobacteria bacterium]|nr:bifunctional serine/threonine-protein kinase/formylglycine-generating enzyme family protein [Acidobacteriota bacterium]
GPIPAHRAIKLFKQILAAIDYAHHFIYSDRSGEKHQGIIHRDLKPANILVTPEDVVKVTDFGIVKVRGVKGGTQMGFNPGTPEYMSPEQARGRELDQRSDIYAMGIVFYEMLTGHVPFEDDGSSTSDYEIRRGHIELPVPPLSQHYPSISPELEKIVLKSLEKNPDDRYQTARQFIDIIEEFEYTGTATIAGRLPGARRTIVQEGRSTGRSNLTEAETIEMDSTVITDPDYPQADLATYNRRPLQNGGANVDGFPRRDVLLRPTEQKSNLPHIFGMVALAVVALSLIIYWLTRRPEQTNTNSSSNVPIGMVSIPAGEFMMGLNSGNIYEKPEHPVKVSPF